MAASTCAALSSLSSPDVCSSQSAAAWCIRTSLLRHGRRISRLQIASERLVLTRSDSADQLFRAADLKRFNVCHRTASLYPSNARVDHRANDALRQALGEVRAEWEGSVRLVDGYRCVRIRVWNDRAHLTVAGDAWVMYHPEIGGTAIGLERACTSLLKPSRIPLPPNALIVRSTFTLGAQHLRDRYSSRLTWVRAAPHDALNLLERVSAYRIQDDPPVEATRKSLPMVAFLQPP